MWLYDPGEVKHRLLYAAHARGVDHDNLDHFIPNLQGKLVDQAGTNFVYLGFVEGDYLNEHVNSERTNFSFPAERVSDEFPDELSLDMIRKATLDYVSLDLKPFLDEINQEKESKIHAFVAEEAPEYRPLLRYMPTFIDQIPPGLTGSRLDTALHQQMYERQRALKQEAHSLMEESRTASLKPDQYEDRLTEFLDRANELGKSSLAQYVAHRKVILEFLERSLEADPETGTYPLEEVVHQIIYPMRTTSDEVPFEQQNLWIIDERLAYHKFLVSDVALNRFDTAPAASKDRPDIMVLESALSFTENDGPLTSLVIIEFKKPGRTTYGNEDPVDQVLRLIREIQSGHFKDSHGREIQVLSNRIPAYAYIVCDITKQIELIAENKGMVRTPDNLGFYSFNPNVSAYIEVISYSKMLTDAKKRNHVLFEKLNLPTS